MQDARAQPAAPQPLPGGTSALVVTLLIQSASSAATIAPTVAAPLLLARLGLGSAVVGLYMALVYFGALVSSQAAAALIRRHGPIRTSQLSLLASAGGLALVTVPSAGAATLGALLIGLGYGPITPASSDILARTTPPGRYSLVFSIKQTGVPLGGAIAGSLVPVVLEAVGLAGSLLQIVALCIASAALGERLRRSLDTQRGRPAAGPRGVHALSAPLRLVWSHRMLRRVALASFVLSATQVCVTSYAVSYLHGDLAWSLVAAGAVLMASQLAGVVGRVLWGAVADRLEAPRAMLVALTLAMAAAGIALAFVTQATPPAAVVAVMVAYGATAIGWNGVYLGTIARLAPPGQAAAATGGSLFFTYAGVVVVPPVFGWVGSQAGRVGVAFAALALPLLLVVALLARSADRPPREVRRPGA